MSIWWWIATRCLNIEQNLRLCLVIKQISHTNITRHCINTEKSIGIAWIDWIPNSTTTSCKIEEEEENISSWEKMKFKINQNALIKHLFEEFISRRFANVAASNYFTTAATSYYPHFYLMREYRIEWKIQQILNWRF